MAARGGGREGADLVPLGVDQVRRRAVGDRHLAGVQTVAEADPSAVVFDGVQRAAAATVGRAVMRAADGIVVLNANVAAEAELAARVAVDALRAGGLTTAMLDGVGYITIAKTNYCVATVREPGNATPRAGAAPLIDSMAASATAAVLTALGSFTDARAQSRARAGH